MVQVSVGQGWSQVKDVSPIGARESEVELQILACFRETKCLNNVET